MNQCQSMNSDEVLDQRARNFIVRRPRATNFIVRQPRARDFIVRQPGAILACEQCNRKFWCASDAIGCFGLRTVQSEILVWDDAIGNPGLRTMQSNILDCSGLAGDENPRSGLTDDEILRSGLTNGEFLRSGPTNGEILWSGLTHDEFLVLGWRTMKFIALGWRTMKFPACARSGCMLRKPELLFACYATQNSPLRVLQSRTSLCMLRKPEFPFVEKKKKCRQIHRQMQMASTN